MLRLLAAASLALLTSFATAHADPIKILAAENFYGEAAAAIGGDRVAVESVIVAPGTDPHDYEPTPAIARSAADAAIVIMNGADYDHWVEHMLEATERPDRVVINVADLAGHKDGDNPHVWYDPKAMPAMAEALATELSRLDPAGAADYATRRDAFLATLAPIGEKVTELRARFEGVPVAATESVFGYMAEAIGLKMENEAFQTAIMNETEPAASDIAAMEDAIRAGGYRVIFYNSQVEDAFTRNIATLANGAGVPLVSVTETQPSGKSFAEWMLDALDETQKALQLGAS